MAWCTNSFTDTILRQRVVAQIDAAREGFELHPGANSSEEMENVLFANSETRDDYMELIATLVLHLNQKKREALRNRDMQQQTLSCNPPPSDMQQQTLSPPETQQTPTSNGEAAEAEAVGGAEGTTNS